MTERTGRCLCGAVRFAAEGIGHIDACHCGMCRRMTGGPVFAAQPTSVTWQEDASLAVHASSDWAERGFCKTCGTWLFYRLTAGGFVTLNAFALDDLSGLGFETEIFVDDKPDLYAFAGQRKHMTGAEVAAAFSGGQ